MSARHARPVIAFFDYPDVFEDFYSHYGVTQRDFCTRWGDTGNHSFVRVLQEFVGDVVWYQFSLAPQLEGAHHELGFRVRMLPSSLLHRGLWNAFYTPGCAWRWRRAYGAYANPASYLSLLSRPFFQAVREDRPDYFFVQDYATGRFDMLRWISLAKRVPLLAYHSGSQPETYLGKTAKRWTIPAADMLVTSSQAESDMLATRYRVPHERLQVILTPIDTGVFGPGDRAAACCRMELPEDRRYILFIGRLDDQVKRISSLIRSFARVTADASLVLLIAGDGPDAKKLRRLASQLAPDRVRFLGWISTPQSKADLYRLSEILVIPSIREGFPTVVGESMACGTPVLGSRVGGIPELVQERVTGWLVEPGDEQMLTQKLAAVVAAPARLAEMRARVLLLAQQRLSPAAVGSALRRCFEASQKRYVSRR